jgi:AhpD family alkylhydroperoxidase
MVFHAARLGDDFLAKQASKQIKHIRAVPTREADELVGEVYDQMKREFQLVPPIVLHSPIPDLLAGVWGVMREAVVAGPTSRVLRETACEAVSVLNRCSFCVDAHSALLNGLGQASTADAIRANRLDLIRDSRTRDVAQWALANRDPESPVLRHPPFSAEEAPEIIGSAVLFHYIDRVVKVFLPDSPVPLPAWLRWLRRPAIRLAGSTIGRKTMRISVSPGGAVGAASGASPSRGFAWARTRPALAAACGTV